MTQQYLIFSDMDGTLLDHHNYSHAAADPLLRELHQRKIPVIPNTSKTFDEMKVLVQQLQLNGPFIVENGAAIHIPNGFFKQKPASTQWSNNHWVRQFTSKKSHWLSLLKRVEKNFEGQFTHFSKMSLADISAATGLDEEQTKRAAARQYGEPVLWLGNEDDKQRFIQSLKLIGAKPLIGGRFIHVSGECDKGQAMLWLIREFKRQYPQLECTSIALGDGQNDAAMLNAADIAVKILSPVNPLPTLHKTEQVYVSEEAGPQGWASSLKHILNITL